MQDVWGKGLDWDEPLWRYMKPERFVSLVEDSRAYFAAAAQFKDRFEGAVAVQSGNLPVDPRYEELEHREDAFRQLKRLTKINCWHRADYESDAMWKLYAGESKGVAICSTASRLRDALQPFRLDPSYAVEDLWAGPVHYQDLTVVRMNVSMLDRFFCKHRAFEWEREFRLAISLRSAEEFGVTVPEEGIEVAVDVDALVERIVLGPELSRPDRERISQRARNAGLEARLYYSSLLGRPRYV